MQPLRETSGREVNAVRMTATEFRAKARQRNSFLREILLGPKMFLVGREHELGELVSAGKAQAS